MPLVRFEPATSRRSTLAREPEIFHGPVSLNARTAALSWMTAPVSPPASSLFDVVSLIDSEEPKPDSTMK